MAGNDLTSMSAETRSILLNKEVIAVDQDALGKPGDRVVQAGSLAVWTRPLAGGALAVALVNQLNAACPMTLKLADIGWTGPAAARDLWAHKDAGIIDTTYTVEVPRHGVVMLRISPVP